MNPDSAIQVQGINRRSEYLCHTIQWKATPQNYTIDWIECHHHTKKHKPQDNGTCANLLGSVAGDSHLSALFHSKALVGSRKGSPAPLIATIFSISLHFPIHQCSQSSKTVDQLTYQGFPVSLYVAFGGQICEHPTSQLKSTITWHEVPHGSYHWMQDFFSLISVSA